ncbi:hypothetical protein BD560DRAFT_477503 [Blakeslea trispora]|nr:hypothetical protein BD560DRAFT_477503 [Blakeslea trispora]
MNKPSRQFSHVQLNKRNYHLPNMNLWHADLETQTEKEEKQPRRFHWLFSSISPYLKTTDSHWPIITYLILFVSLIVFSGELVFNRQRTGEYFELEPINYMLGPSVEIMIQSGARFTPCMRPTPSMPPTEHYPLLLLDSVDDPVLLNVSCSLVSFCGMSGFQREFMPDQNYRFFTSLLIHVGLFHLLINSIGLFYLGCRIEACINSLWFSILFLGSGIFGHIFGDCFALSINPFLGYSSSLFGLIGFMYVDLVFHWRTLEYPIRSLVKLVLYTLLGFLYGLLPSVDSFSHVGGLIAGILIGNVLYPIDKENRQKQKVVLYSIKLICLSIYSVVLVMLIRYFWSTD